MDVLRPPIIKIGRRRYRKNPIQGSSEDLPYEEEADYNTVVYEDESCDIECNIEKTDGGYKVKIDVPSAYFKFIIGKKGETKRQIEHETQTRITIPKQGQEGEIIINGHDQRGVISAKTRIDVLLESARQKQPFTHFLSFPICGANIKDKFLEFKEDVLRYCDGDKGIDKTIFQNPDKLHLTIGTLVLLNEKEILQATELLKQCKDDLVDPILKMEPLIANFTELEYMNDDPNSVNVLYVKVSLLDESDRLQMLSDTMAHKFLLAGLMQKDYDRVKLHVTIMNTLMRKDRTGTLIPPSQYNTKGPMKDREAFDAANILKLYGNYNFGQYHINELHLSERYSTGRDGYYKPAAVIKLC